MVMTRARRASASHAGGHPQQAEQQNQSLHSIITTTLGHSSKTACHPHSANPYIDGSCPKAPEAISHGHTAANKSFHFLFSWPAIIHPVEDLLSKRLTAIKLISMSIFKLKSKSSLARVPPLTVQTASSPTDGNAGGGPSKGASTSTPINLLPGRANH